MPAHRDESGEPLDPSGIAQFVEHDRCPRYIKQRVDPEDEPDARDWREAFGLMNVALLGNGQEFEARQVEALAADATTVIGPELGDPTNAAVPDIPIDETWADSGSGRAEQLRTAVRDVQTLPTPTGDTPYILCYQAPLGGQVGAHDIWGEADCLMLAPAAASTDAETPTTPEPDTADTDEAEVVARVLEIKSASEERPSHRVQVAIYSALLEGTLAEGPTPTPTCRIETSVLTQTTAAEPGEALHPFVLPTFRRAEWELFAKQLLATDGPIDEALSDDLADLPYTLDQVCDNCAYKEACATRAVEDPTAPASLALLGLDASVQRALQETGITTLRELAALLPRLKNPRPTDEPPRPDLPADTRRALEEALPGPIHETVQRAQAIRGMLDPEYPAHTRPPAIPGTDWVPLPDDRCQDWSNIDDADPGTLIHVALFVRPATTIDRVAALGACVSAGAHDEYVTIGEVIGAIPDDPSVAETVECELFECFLDQLFDAIETVATALGDPEEAVMHCYTYSDHETDALAAGLDRHAGALASARAVRNLLSLHADGHTGQDQDMLSAVQPICNEHFALQYPSQGLLTVADQFIHNWTLEAFDPLDARDDAPPLRAIFRERFLNQSVPYVEAEPGIHLHLARGPLGEGPAAAAADTDTANPTPDGWYPIRKRAGGQFPLEYIWAVTPKQPDETTPRLTPAVVEDWDIDADSTPLYKQEISRYYYRTDEQANPLQRGDVEYLVERLSYTLLRLVEAIPYKDTYHPKEPVDATSLRDFELPVSSLPEAARDYLRMEFGAQREATYTHYRQSLRDRARSGRSVPIRCTDYTRRGDGSLAVTGELAYDELFADAATANQVARQARLRSGDGPGGGSWRVLTQLQPAGDDTDDTTHTDSAAPEPASPSARGHTAVGVEDATALAHSPPVLVETLDPESGTITLTLFPHRFQRTGSPFRVDHCGWDSPGGSNLDAPEKPPTDRPGYVAGRHPVRIDTDELYMLDPMVDDFGAPKADRALIPDMVAHNAFWQHLQAIRQTGQHQAALVGAPADIDGFLHTLATAEDCLTPNDDQQAFIRAVDRALVPLQGPPGTGKTRGGIAPALLARAYARAQHDESVFGLVIAPSHDAVDATLDGVVECLADWRAATDGLPALDLVRVLPTTPPPEDARVDAAMPAVDVTYCNYHSDSDATRLGTLASDVLGGHATSEEDATQWLLFATPATLYRTLGVLAEALSAIDGNAAPAAMRHDPGLADVVCIDEASMLDLPNLFLATSALKPTGQTLLVGDHRQLATVTKVDWANTLRKPLAETQAYRSALEYLRWVNTTTTGAPSRSETPPSGDSHQTDLSGFTTPAVDRTATGGEDGDT